MSEAEGGNPASLQDRMVGSVPVKGDNQHPDRAETVVVSGAAAARATSKRPAFGVAMLADRPVSIRAATRFLAVTYLLMGIAAVPALMLLETTSERPPMALAALGRAADLRDPWSPGTVANDGSRRPPTVLLLIDGLRRDDVPRMPILRALGDRSVAGEVALPLPTKSQPFYHALMTGVPPDGTGYRRNRGDPTALLDGLPNRTRAVGDRVIWIAENDTTLFRMFGEANDRRHLDGEALDEALEQVLAEISATRTAGRRAGSAVLLVVHILCVDAAAHHHGVRTTAHDRALVRADAVVGRLTRSNANNLWVFSDHGHLLGGGHGGDEPAVQRVPFFFLAGAMDGSRGPDRRPVTAPAGSAVSLAAVRAPAETLTPAGRRGSVTAGQVMGRPMSVEEIGPTIAATMGIDAPRSAVALAAPELVDGRFAAGRPVARATADPGGGARPIADLLGVRGGVELRRRLLLRSTAAAARDLGHHRLGWAMAIVLIAVMALGAHKRALGGLGWLAVLSPIVWLGATIGSHRFIFARPLTQSAIDEGLRHGLRLSITASLWTLALACGVAALVATVERWRPGAAGANAFVPRLPTSQPWPAWRLTLVRTAALHTWFAVLVAGLAAANVGMGFGPWSLDAVDRYAPIFALGSLAGVGPTAAVLLWLGGRARGQVPPH